MANNSVVLIFGSIRFSKKNHLKPASKYVKHTKFVKSSEQISVDGLKVSRIEKFPVSSNPDSANGVIRSESLLIAILPPIPKRFSNISFFFETLSTNAYLLYLPSKFAHSINCNIVAPSL